MFDRSRLAMAFVVLFALCLPAAIAASDGEREFRVSSGGTLTLELDAGGTVFITGTGGSSARLYREQRLGGGMEAKPKLDTPLGVSYFPKEVIRAPREWIETKFDVKHWTDMPRGGHFAALEQPELLVEDVRKFFRSYR